MIGRADLRIGLLSGVLALLITVFLFPAVASAGDTLSRMDVPNSGFESEQTSNAIPDWNYWNPSYGMLTISTSKKFSGSQSLRFVKTETGLNKSFGAESALLDVEPGETYEASIKLNIESMEHGSALWIRWFDESGQPLQKQAVYSIPTNSPLNVWLDIKVKGTAPLDAEKATIFLYSTSDVKLTANVDNAHLFRLADYNLALNPGFEESTLGTTLPQRWSIYNDSQPANTQTSIVTDPGGSSKVLKIWDNNDTSPGGSVGVNSDTIYVEEGLTYEAKLKSKLVSGSQIAYIKFYNNPDGKHEHEVGSFSTGITNANSAWNTVTVTGTAPPNAIRARVLLYSSTGAKSEGYFDDVSFYFKGLDSSHSRKSPIDLGEATLGRLTKGGAIKNNKVYFATNGSPAIFYVFDAITRTLIDSERVPGTDVVWGITVGSDNNVYFASTVANNQKLYKYDVSAGSVSSVGQYPGSNHFVWDLEAVGNKIYGATSGANGEVFSYDIAAPSNPIVTMGSINSCPGTLHPCQGYVRGLGSSGNYLYAGMGANKYLTKTNLTNNVTEEIELGVTGQDGFISDILYRNGFFYFAQTSSLIVMDSVTGSEVKTIYGADRISTRIPYGSSALLYYQNVFDRKLYAYNSANHASNPMLVTTVTEFPDSAVRAMEWINDNGRYKLAILFEDTRYALYDPKFDTPADDDTLEIFQLTTEMSALNIQSLARAPDGKIYLGGFLGGMSVYDDASGQYLVQAPGPHQIEEIGFLGNTAYFGVYSGSKIYQYAYGGTPNLIRTIGSEQDRPYVFTSGENKLFVGTIPTYGKLGGALSVYDGSNWSTFRNVVQDQSVIALAYRGPQRILYGGTSVDGGLDSNPDPNATAKIFKWNVATNALITTEPSVFTPAIPGMAKPKMIGHLSIGPDGNLWGGAWGNLTADPMGDKGYALFKMNPDTNEIQDSVIVYMNAESGSTWRGFYLYWYDGLLYTTIGRYLTVFDPNNLADNTRILNSNVTLMTMDANGNIFYAIDSNLYKLPK